MFKVLSMPHRVRTLFGVSDGVSYQASKPASNLHEGVVGFCERLLIPFTVSIRHAVESFKFGHNSPKNLIGIE